ncbi:DUF3000 domain-containing protein [Phaeacidiphilus oryzae]|uniref:DUF3000 domain-containing protein n=1 Tax=Phaeacidiphilus oryzae TaxID=348818 RepID=UPI0009FBE1F4|nr:DUF3000 domain-containing protein [Phaeacidiphilus oryzae]
MAAVSGHPADSGGPEDARRAGDSEGAGDPDGGHPSAFRRAVTALRSARPRPEVRLEEAPAPRRLAPHAFALTAAVESEGEELADGRFVLLHEPDGHKAWNGAFRVVTLARAELEPEMAGDPLLPDVAWSWLVDALAQRGAEQHEAGGSVTRAATHHFGTLSERPTATEIELRASWTPLDERLDRHLAAWCELLCSCAGLPPVPAGPPVPPHRAADGPVGRPPAGVVRMPTRRRPRH